MTIVRALAMVALVGLTPAKTLAQDPRILQGNELYEAFRQQQLEYSNGAVQSFNADGTTEYRKDPDWDLSGFWWVDTNLLCFALQPGQQNQCFRVRRDVGGMTLNLDASGGGSLTLRYRLSE